MRAGFVIAALAACSGSSSNQPTAASGAPATTGAKSGAALCVLTPADFQSVGVTAGAPTANVSEGGTYCVYAGKSAAMGGVELDVFELASTAEADQTEATAAGEATQTLQPLPIAGADHARWDPKAKSGGPEFASLLVRRGKLVFVIGLPASADAQQKLTTLGGLVLARL